MAYYLCWHKLDSRMWLVKARNADDARRLLAAAGEISQEEARSGDRVVVRCAQSSCRQYNTCGKKMVRL